MDYKFGIIGYPLSHSLSPVLHKAAFDSVGLSGTYDILETKPEDLVSVLKTLKSQNYNGFNVTIPHKVPIALFLTDYDNYANLSGSVNTIKINEDKTLVGYNTDVYGFIESIPKEIKPKLINATVAVFGTGGACRAICTAFSTLGVKQIDLYSRNIIDAHESANGLRTRFKSIQINLIQSEMLTSLKSYKMVVNTTPIGMKNFAETASPLTDETVKTLSEDSLIYDVVYNPLKTELIRQAIKFEKKYVGGLDMLVYQGAKAFEIWTGSVPNVDKMKIAALENLL